MTDFRKRLLGVLGATVVFAGLANAQYTCGAPGSAGTLMRAEGTTEQTADLTITCTTATAIAAGAANVNLTVSPSLPITSKSLGTVAGVNYTEALAVAPGGTVQGVVAGTGAINFLNVPTPACAAAPCTFGFTITNVRVNATSVGAGPVAISESALVTASGALPVTVNPTLVGATAVGIVLNGLTATTVPGGSNVNGTICSGYSPAVTAAGPPQVITPSFTVNFGENFSTAFKTQGTSAGNAALGSWAETANNTETGYTNGNLAFPTVGGVGANVANSGTRIKIIYSGLAGNMNIYVPLVRASTAGGGSMTLVATETGPFAAAGATTDSIGAGGNAFSAATLATLGKLTVSGGTATAIYEITAQAAGVTTTDAYSVPAFITVSANTIPQPGTTVTATVQFASASGGNIPNFAVGSSTNSVNGPSFGICSTTILFPYVTAGGGFDTGLVISNTSTDNLRAGGGNSVSTSAGVCTLSFFGTNAPTPVVTASVATASLYLNTASSIAPGFTGYMIAQCNFLYGHGFAYITYNLTQNNGAAMGYLGLNLGTGRGTPTSAAPESLNN